MARAGAGGRCTVLQFHRDRLIGAFHQEPASRSSAVVLGHHHQFDPGADYHGRTQPRRARVNLPDELHCGGNPGRTGSVTTWGGKRVRRVGIDVGAVRCGRLKLQKLFDRLMTEQLTACRRAGCLAPGAAWFAWGDHVTTYHAPPLTGLLTRRPRPPNQPWAATQRRIHRETSTSGCAIIILPFGRWPSRSLLHRTHPAVLRLPIRPLTSGASAMSASPERPPR